jgi:hypothetical protein
MPSSVLEFALFLVFTLRLSFFKHLLFVIARFAVAAQLNFEVALGVPGHMAQSERLAW